MTISSSHLSHPKYRPDIDGLRALAVLSVVAFHAFPKWMKGGFIGVDVFFVISGFLISTILLENLNAGTFSFAEFYSRRIRRIFPALIFVLISCLGFAWFALLAEELNQLGKHAAAGAGFISNLILWSEAGYFDSAAERKPLLHLWSLGVEEQFYIVWPVLLWLAAKRKFNFLMLVALAAFLSFFANVEGVRSDPVAAFYSPLTRFWELLCGSLLAWWSMVQRGVVAGSAEKRPWDGYGDRQKRLSSALSFLGLLVLGYGFLMVNKDFSFPGYWALVPVLGAALIILAGPQGWVNRMILSNKIIVWFGLISFPLYLWHWPILSFGRIVYLDSPPIKFKMLAIAVSVLLAWLTVLFVEKPFRFGSKNSGLKVVALSVMAFTVGILGFAVSRADFSATHTAATLGIKRDGEHAIGHSLAWYRGKEDWLFLGNAYDNTVAKMKLSVTPGDNQIQATRKMFANLAAAGAQYGAKVVLLMGPDKSSIYPEYLPEGVVPSERKYSSFFLDSLKGLDNLVIHDPTNDFISRKNSEGILYWKSDTHWNNKGAFLAYAGFLKTLALPIPAVEFRNGAAYSGDLVRIANLKNFPLHAKDNWDVLWKEKSEWKETERAGEQKTTFGSVAVVINEKPLSNKYIWVVGDSFTGALRQYFNATFKEVRYIGHWEQKLNSLPSALAAADKKPDMIVVVRVERSF